MKKISRFLAAMTACLMLTALFGCGNKEKELPEVVLRGLPEEAVTSNIVVSGFAIDIYRTYACVTGYEGDAVDLGIPPFAVGVAVKKIGDSAFKDNEKIESVVLPEGIVIIGKNAFDGCKKLKKAVLNDGLETVGDYAFRNSGIEECVLPDSVGQLCKYCFYGCAGLKGTLHIPANLSEPDKYAFYGCSSLTGIEFSPRLSRISEKMFSGCSGLVSVDIPKSVKRIDEYAFSNCASLSSVTLTEGTVKFGEGIFVGCPSVTVTVPDGSEAAKYTAKNNYKTEITVGK
ncbi:MAG: leucine-rich repeat domain-containing protein [Firmicutes bacterium]|nr:leucine-rich repeat domain-containing protein [Candidatus Colimorpha enterica]